VALINTSNLKPNYQISGNRAYPTSTSITNVGNPDSHASLNMTQPPIPDESFTVQAVGGIVGGMLFLLVFAFLVGLTMRRQKRKRYQKRIEEATAKSVNPRP
jgi:hypothetical protein